MLVVCCGLLAKWGLGLGLGLGLGPGIALGVFSSSCSVISVVNTFVFVGTVSARRSARDGLLMNIQ